MKEIDIINFYKKYQNKGRYWIADELKVNRNYFCSLIDKHFPNSTPINLILEKDVETLIQKYPYTGTMVKIAKILGVSKHKIQQINLKTKNIKINQHFSSPKHSSTKLTEEEINLIL